MIYANFHATNKSVFVVELCVNNKPMFTAKFYVVSEAVFTA
jgi:hypothetical protein